MDPNNQIDNQQQPQNQPQPGGYYPPSAPQPGPQYQVPVQPQPDYSSFSDSSYQQNSSQSPFAGRGRLIILAAVALFVLVGLSLLFGVFFGGNNGDVISRDEGTLDLTTLINPEESLQSQKINAKLNQQVNLSTGLSYMVRGFERDWKPADEELDIVSGYEVIKVDYTIGNRDANNNYFLNAYDFRMEIESDPKLEPDVIASNLYLDNALNSMELKTGEQLQVSLLYAVQFNEKVMGVMYDEEFIANNNEPINISSFIKF